MSIFELSEEQKFYVDTVYTGVRLTTEGTEIVRIGGAIRSLGSRHQKPNSRELEELRDAITKCQAHLDVYQVALAKHEAIKAEEAAFEEDEEADEHQQDIANGAVSFKAFRDARGGL